MAPVSMDFITVLAYPFLAVLLALMLLVFLTFAGRLLGGLFSAD